ncbi:hypothetical protein [Streptococcus hyointestinalis]|uniref:hypothetical protein n=1 Tax=Streptococcus hyointestinalis TaxID=1337 RepID=UPI0013DFF9FC|nr:hypothetical protein [Streptococcus hyointestinalis]
MVYTLPEKDRRCEVKYLRDLKASDNIPPVPKVVECKNCCCGDDNKGTSTNISAGGASTVTRDVIIDEEE